MTVLETGFDPSDRACRYGIDQDTRAVLREVRAPILEKLPEVAKAFRHPIDANTPLGTHTLSDIVARHTTGSPIGRPCWPAIAPKVISLAPKIPLRSSLAGWSQHCC